MSNLEFRSHQSYIERTHDNLVQKIDAVGAGAFLTSVRNTITVVGPTTLNLTPDQSGTTVLCQTTGGAVTVVLPLIGGLPPPAGTWYHINRDTAANAIIVDSQGVGISGRSLNTVEVIISAAATVTDAAGTIGDNITVMSNGVLWYIVGVAAGYA